MNIFKIDEEIPNLMKYCLNSMIFLKKLILFENPINFKILIFL